MDIELESSLDARRVELYPGSIFSPRGYAYVFPLDSQHARIGVCTAGRRDFDVSQAMKAFASERGGQWRHPRHAFQCEAISGGRVRKLFDGHVLAIGDRAGHLSPVMGEGIRFAFLAADLAAPLAEAWLGGDSRAFERFEVEWRQVAGRRHEWALLAQRVLAVVGTRSFDWAVRRVAAAASEDPDVWLRVLSTSFVRSDLRRLLLARSG
jgi:flavin-dependent dehydrogenase